MDNLEKKWYNACLNFIEDIDLINNELTAEEKQKIIHWYEGMIKMRTMADNILSTKESN